MNYNKGKSKFSKPLPKKSQQCRCYCQKKFCDSFQNINPTHKDERQKFVKIRDEHDQGILKHQQCDYDKKISPFQSNLNTPFPSRTSFTESSTNFVPLNSKSSTYVFPDSAINPNLTESRAWYEQSKLFNYNPNFKVSGAGAAPSFSSSTDNMEIFMHNMADDKIAEINNFRLKNSEDCFSVLSKHAMHKRIESSQPIQDHICEFKYHLNERGLLKTTISSDNGRPICIICKKIGEIPEENGILLVDKARQPHKIILEVKDSQKSVSSEQSVSSQKRLMPTNSLALLYQKTL